MTALLFMAVSAEGGGFNLFQWQPGAAIWSIVIFLLALPLMIKFVFGPITRALDERDKKVEAAAAAAEDARRAAEEAVANAASEREEARAEARQMVQAAQARAERQAQEALEAAKAASPRERPPASFRAACPRPAPACASDSRRRPRRAARC